MKKLTVPWSMDITTVQDELKSNPEKGLSAAEAKIRLEEAGLNKITVSKPITFWHILLEEIREPLIMLLLVIGVIYSIWGEIGDAVTIVIVIIAVTLIEVYTEYSAKKRIESLHKLTLPSSWVIRDGRPVEIETSLIVPGDVLILKSGVKVGADARVVEALGLEADESQLTGESLGAAKITAAIDETAGLSDRKNMVFMGSVMLKGKGLAIVVSTGMNTELGRISGLTQEAREPKTPLQKSMKQLSKTLIWIAGGFSVLIPVLGIMRSMPLQSMILTGLSLAFATMPEEMPIIVTMLLGLGAINLSRKNVLIRRTKAAETLGNVTVIATDKTGTLTENKMSIEKWAAGDEKQLFTIGALTADIAYDSEGGFLGDPMDKAVVDRARELGIERKQLLSEYALVEDSGFDQDKNIFRASYSFHGRMVHTLKGAPESVFDISRHDEAMDRYLEEFVQEGLRTIAFALKMDNEELYSLKGLVTFDDRIRIGVKEAIEDCRAAGVKVMMITGDHASTARRVASNVSIPADMVVTGEEISSMDAQELRDSLRKSSVFARISPEQKLMIVNALRDSGEIVGVTGDGINDAPALKSADIGISMGLSGTDVAKEASDMILTNDSFISVVDAIREGRRVYDNLSKCVKYYLSCKVGLILSFLAPVLLGIPLPFSPIQIIILEVFMDLAASTSFVAEKEESDLLRRKPKDPKESFMNGRMMKGILGGSLTLAAIVLMVYLYSWFTTGSTGTAQTYGFIAWMFGHVALAFNMRTENVPLSESGFFSSKPFNIWMAGVVAFLVAAINLPVLNRYMKLSAVGIMPLVLIALIAVAATSWIEILKHISKSKKQKKSVQ